MNDWRITVSSCESHSFDKMRNTADWSVAHIEEKLTCVHPYTEMHVCVQDDGLCKRITTYTRQHWLDEIIVIVKLSNVLLRIIWLCCHVVWGEGGCVPSKNKRIKRQQLLNVKTNHHKKKQIIRVKPKGTPFVHHHYRQSVAMACSA